MQLERVWSADGWGWGAFFEQNYGWTWEEVVRDLDIHFRAARIVWERCGGFAGPWRPSIGCWG